MARLPVLAPIFALTLLPSLACSPDEPGGGDEVGDSETDTSTTGETDTGESGTDTDTGESSSDTDSETDTGTDTEPPGNLLLSDQFLNIAHRGGGLLAPEATLPAFENALVVGADVLEMDLHASSDGVVVVIHDDTVDRTTDGTGAVKDMTFEELRMLDAGYDFTQDGGMTFPWRDMGVQIPSLDEILTNFSGEYFLLEIKQVEPSIVPLVLESIADHGVEDHVVIASFEQVTIDEVRALAPEQFTAMTPAEMIDFTNNGGDPGYEAPCQFVQSPWEFTSPELVQQAHELGLKVHPWTLNAEAGMLDMIAAGVDGVMTDDPALLESLI